MTKAARATPGAGTTIAPSRRAIVEAGLRLLGANGLAGPLDHVPTSLVAEHARISPSHTARLIGQREAHDQLVLRLDGFRSGAMPSPAAAAFTLIERSCAGEAAPAWAVERIHCTEHPGPGQALRMSERWAFASRYEMFRSDLVQRTVRLHELITYASTFWCDAQGVMAVPPFRHHDLATVSATYLCGKLCIDRITRTNAAAGGESDAPGRRTLADGLAAWWHSLTVAGGATPAHVAPDLGSIVPVLVDPALHQVASSSLGLLDLLGPAGPTKHLRVRPLAYEAAVSPATLYRHWQSMSECVVEIEAALYDRGLERFTRRRSTAPVTEWLPSAFAHWSATPHLVELLARSDHPTLAAGHLAALETEVADNHPDADICDDLLAFVVGMSLTRRARTPSRHAWLIGAAIAHHLLSAGGAR